MLRDPVAYSAAGSQQLLSVTWNQDISYLGFFLFMHMGFRSSKSTDAESQICV